MISASKRSDVQYHVPTWKVSAVGRHSIADSRYCPLEFGKHIPMGPSMLLSSVCEAAIILCDLYFSLWHSTACFGKHNLASLRLTLRHNAVFDILGGSSLSTSRKAASLHTSTTSLSFSSLDPGSILQSVVTVSSEYGGCCQRLVVTNNLCDVGSHPSTQQSSNQRMQLALFVYMSHGVLGSGMTDLPTCDSAIGTSLICGGACYRG